MAAQTPDFLTTPDDAQGTALDVVAQLSAEKWKCSIEKPIGPDAPLATTVLAERANYPTLMIEAQKVPSYGLHMSNLALHLRANRVFGSLIIVTGIDAHVPAKLFTQLKKDGVGLWMVDGSSREALVEPSVPALILTPDPTLALGRAKGDIKEIVDRFNTGDRKPAFQDLCELVELETHKALTKAAAKGIVQKTKVQVAAMQWSSQIDLLGASKDANGKALIDSKVKADLHSFRDARNLVDHKALSAKAKREREQQLVEKSMLGCRLTAELVQLIRRL